MPYAMEHLYLERHMQQRDVQQIEDMLRRITNVASTFLTATVSNDTNVARMAAKIKSLGLLTFGTPQLRSATDLDR